MGSGASSTTSGPSKMDIIKTFEYHPRLTEEERHGVITTTGRRKSTAARDDNGPFLFYSVTYAADTMEKRDWKPKGIVLFQHGILEHSRRYRHVFAYVSIVPFVPLSSKASFVHLCRRLCSGILPNGVTSLSLKTTLTTDSQTATMYPRHRIVKAVIFRSTRPWKTVCPSLAAYRVFFPNS